MTARAWLLASGVVFSAGCGGSPDEQRGGQVRSSIVLGEPSGASDDGVVLIRAVDAEDRDVVCTASVVAPNLLLTARHCVSYLTDGDFSCSVRGELIDNPTGAGRLGVHLPAQSIEVYGRDVPRSEPLARGKQVISTLSETICVNDIAFVVLDTALDLPVLPLRLERPAEVGELGAMIGFGLDETETSLDFVTQPRSRKGGLPVLDVGPDSLEQGVTTVPPRTVILEGPSGCVGDSGGPLVAEATGAVLGVYSLQQGESCTAPKVRHHLVHVPPFELLIQQAFAAAEATPLPEPSAEPTPEGGAGGETSLAGGGDATAPSVAGAGGAEGGEAGAPPGDGNAKADSLKNSGCALTSGARPADQRPLWAALLVLLVAWRARRAQQPAC